jgi:hypothetical protein
MFENRRALPRARFVDSTVEMSHERALETLRTGQLPSGDRFDPAATALVMTGTGVVTHAGCQRMPVEWIDDHDGLTSLSVNLEVPCFLVLADTFYDGWTVHVDGQPSAIHRTNFAFRGVEVPAGRHRVQFEFASATLRAGACVSGMSILAVGIVLVRRRRGRWSNIEAGTTSVAAQ